MYTNKLLTVDEVAEILRTTPNTVYRWLRSGKMVGVKVGKEWRIQSKTLDAMFSNPRVVSAREGCLDKIGPGPDHLMVVTSKSCDLYDLEAKFFIKGMALGHRLFKGCWWQHPDDVRNELTTRGVPVQTLERDDELVVVDLYNLYKRHGIAAPVNSWANEAKKSVTMGYGAMWGSGSPHLLSCDGDISSLVKFEGLLNDVLNHLPVVGICPYIFEECLETFLAPLIDLANHHNSVLFYQGDRAVFLSNESPL